MSAKFDKFSTLGLDYKPAFKSSEDYISFLIQRDDSKYDIPLSEMKLFLKRLEAEKFIDLKTGDIISIEGIVFSDALGDAWIDVSKLKVTQKTQEKDGVK
jgi:lysyl-tRNA synthetase class II